jgi:hypothetical protein
MKKQTIFLLFGIFVFLLALTFVPNYWSTIVPQTKPKEFTFTPFTKDTTTSIHLSSAGKQVTVSKSDTVWKVDGKDASKDKVDSLFAALSKTVLGEVVSNNPKNAEDYSLSSSSATLLNLTGNAKNLVVLIGKRGQAGDSFYVKKDGSNIVYLANGGLFDVLSTNVSDWQDKTVVNIPSADIASILIDGAKKLMIIKKDDKNWDITKDGNKKTVPDDDAKTSIGAVASITATDFATEEDNKIFTAAKGSFNVSFANKDGKGLAHLTVVPTENQYYLAKVTGKEDTYKIAPYIIEGLFTIGEKKP